jgi:uncharacterized membrane protein
MTTASEFEVHAPLPAVRQIGFADLRAALREGLADFREIPSFAVFLCLFYPVVGLLIGGFMLRYDVAPLLFPLAAGFALIGPFAAIGLYELSRRRELGLDSSWEHAFDVFRSPAKWAILELGMLMLAIFFAWLLIAQGLYAETVGRLAPRSAEAFFRDVFTTPAGWHMFIWGNLIGFGFAVLSMCISVISFPLLLDKHVSAAAAILTSGARGTGKSEDHGVVGTDCRDCAVCGLDPVPARPGRRNADSRACNLASVSPACSGMK